MPRESREISMIVRKIQVDFQSDGEEKEKTFLLSTNAAADTNATWERRAARECAAEQHASEVAASDHSISASGLW